ncbi:NUDIX domain-containing protein [Elizabethkingia argentiflava]|uniref:NUDIX domain-containing protein n=1 Tax=Elizabethkingia argenteiflava TaxID=2681556 RepID=A0A845PV66_9FLAO|nr:NUDIX domain-containing protein [Elizabethkingia argenteiflava]NAW52119.1 NUDIX domain-containing protein [Elizabethkingia argenteiflava]
MYKVFINERKLSFTNTQQKTDKNLKFVNDNTFHTAIDLLENSPTSSVNIYARDTEEVWRIFLATFKNITAAGGIVLNSNNDILFIHRLSKWDLPKGKMEEGESSEITALREVEEECSISDLSIEKFISPTYHMYMDQVGNRILKITYWYKMLHHGLQKPHPQEIEGITKAEWVPQRDIKTKILPNTFQNIHLILQETLDL